MGSHTDLNLMPDCGASASARYYVARHAVTPTHVGVYADPWAGNPDTDKYWSK